MTRPVDYIKLHACGLSRPIFVMICIYVLKHASISVYDFNNKQ